MSVIIRRSKVRNPSDGTRLPRYKAGGRIRGTSKPQVSVRRRRSKGGEYRGESWYVCATKVPPWTRRRNNRRHNAIAKASRRANR